jgi:hypothetical protein
MHILVECFADTLFVELLGYKCNADHSNIGNVAKRMKMQFVGEKVLGIADNDPTLPLYFDEFSELYKNESFCIRYFKHKTLKNRFLILINPDIEGLIIRLEQESKTKAFAKTKAKLAELTKTHTVKANKRLVTHLQNLIAKNPPSISFLKKCIADATKAK